MKELTETNERLAEVRKARKAAAIMTSALSNDPKRAFKLSVTLRQPMPHFTGEWKDSEVGLDLLDYALRDRLRANLAQAIAEADRDLHAEERRLCEELVRLAAKTAAAGL